MTADTLISIVILRFFISSLSSSISVILFVLCFSQCILMAFHCYICQNFSDVIAYVNESSSFSKIYCTLNSTFICIKFFLMHCSLGVSHSLEDRTQSPEFILSAVACEQKPWFVVEDMAFSLFL